MNKTIKRIISMVLCFVMVLGFVPANVFAATGDVIDAAIFCSDVHGHPSTVTSVFNGIKNADSTFKPSTASFVGDTQCDASSVTSAAQDVFTDVKCYYAFGNHDDENGNTSIPNVTGLLYGDKDTNYYIYAISENSMASSNPDTTDFTNTVAELDKTKPLFIISHLPLHSRRGDSNGAAVWYPAISEAAKSMDIFFFWAHNHTSEGAADTAAYYVAKNGSETITLEDTTTVVTPNFTYANAGYIQPPNGGARTKAATAVRIYEDSVNLTVYTTSGELTGTYAVNETITREFANSTGETTPTVNTVTCRGVYNGEENLDVITATGTGLTAVSAVWSDADVSAFQADEHVAYDVTLTGYTEGDTVTLTFTINAMTSDDLVVYDGKGNQADPVSVVENDGSITVTVKTTSADSTFVIGKLGADENATMTGIEVTTMPDITNYTLVVDNAEDGNIHLDITGMVVNAVYNNGQKIPLSWNQFKETIDGYALVFNLRESGTVKVTYGDFETSFEVTIHEANAKDVDVSAAVAGTLKDGYIAKDIKPSDYTEGTKINVIMPAPEGANVVYHVEEDNTLTEVEKVTFKEGYVIFATDHFSTYVVGEGAGTEITVPGPETATGSGETTTTTKKTVYVLTSSISSGNEYLIVNGNAAGSYYALANNNGSVAATGVTVKTDSEIGTYIELDDATDELWTVAGNYTFACEDGYLYRASTQSGSTYVPRINDSSTTWSYNTNNHRLSYTRNNSTYYLYYSSGWKVTTSTSSAGSIYFYVPTEIDVETTTNVSGTYSIAGNPAEVTKVVTAGATATLGSTLTFTPTSGSAATEDVSATATYTVVEGGDPNGVISGISGNTVTFSGNYGKALVKVSYTTDFGVVTNYITVNASEPYYKVELHKKNDDGTLELIEAPIALKGVKANDTYSVWAVVKYYDGIIEDGEDGKDLGDVEDDRLYWTVSDTSIATIDPATGVITFTGNSYGTFDVTVYYRDADGNILCEDTITISSTESQYVVPGDHTDDFPEYPTQGAIRFDKTAVAQGNFSQSGIAKVELSMTGVPYGTNVATDVIVMVDMTSSMDTNDITAAKLAVQELIETLVYDEENDDYDENIHLFVSSFSSGTSTSNIVITDHLSDVTISTSEELAEAKAAITDSTDGFRDDRHSTNGTHYGVALADVYETMNREGAAENQFVIFVTDGVPTKYWYLNSSGTYTEVTGSNSDTSSLAAGWFDDEGAVTSSFQTEYYTYLIKTAGVPVYTIGANLSSGSDASDLINHMSSNYSPDGKTSTGETKYSFTCTTSGGITDTVLEIFRGIGADIKEAATNVVVEDKIDSHYTMNFSLPENVTAAEAGMENFYIQVLSYELDENNVRKANPTVLEKFLFNSDGTITHTIGTTTCENCTHVTKTGDKITGIDGTYFDYTVDADGDEFLTWTAEKLDRNELALEYFVYLDHSAGVGAADQVAPGTYPTNEYATITYTNFNGKKCQQYFPVPTMTWMGAKVTYVFYLVNEDGKPVNRAGKIIPFAEAIFVTDPVTYDVTWNEEAGIERLSADYLAVGKVPDVYELYDKEAYYEIRVYQTEGVDEETNVVNYNYFVISGADNKLIDSEMDTDTTADNSTTKVYNTKAGVKYDEYGVYSQQNAGTVLNTTYVDENGNETPGTVTTTVKTDSIDYANTTVAFAVVWKPELVPDAVVIDYGLDVIIDVTTNDALASGVVGVSTVKPDVAINNGTYKNSVMGTSAEIKIDDLIIGTAKVENLGAVRFSLNESSGMQFSKPVEFYYESACNYYTYDGENKTLNTTHMYSSVTVIPATTIYYEDDFLSLDSYTKDSEGIWKLDEKSAWTTEGTRVNDTQDQDRPGASKISADLDADNNYGYDSAYEEMSTHSMGSAAQITVDANTRGEATFTFCGTGFDVISTTSNTSGTITVKVMDKAGNVVENTIVDTYYGYTRDADGKWVITNETANALYQVPVIKIFGLTYGQYTVKITAGYNDFFNHTAAESSYDLYLDAIRIYDPTGDQNDVANDAYIADGEAYPEYFEVRDQIISKETYDSLNDATVSGIVFIDGAVNGPSIEDYKSYGPNNEVYLTNGQAIAFDLNGTYTVPAGMELAKIQLAVKTTGSEGHVEVYGVKNGTKVPCLDETISTATDMYYDITALEGMTVVIKSTGAAIVSITNVKVTYQPATTDALATTSVEETEAPMLFSISRASADAALVTLCAEKPAEPTEPETEPTEPETEPTEPETEPTEPETEPTEPETEPTEPETEPTEPETTEPEVTEPEEDNSDDVIKETVAKAIRKIVKKLFGWLFG